MNSDKPLDSRRKAARGPRTLDVRELLQRGEEPLPHVLEILRILAPGETFIIISPFIPAPLIEKLGSEGFTVRPEHRADGAWQTTFTRPRT